VCCEDCIAHSQACWLQRSPECDKRNLAQCLFDQAPRCRSVCASPSWQRASYAPAILCQPSAPLSRSRGQPRLNRRTGCAWPDGSSAFNGAAHPSLKS
jgi:hypothetical protein